MSGRGLRTFPGIQGRLSTQSDTSPWTSPGEATILLIGISQRHCIPRIRTQPLRGFGPAGRIIASIHATLKMYFTGRTRGSRPLARLRRVLRELDPGASQNRLQPDSALDRRRERRALTAGSPIERNRRPRPRSSPGVFVSRARKASAYIIFSMAIL
jgi:hypothetical protein